MPNSEQMFRADENEKLTDISIAREIVEQEIDRLKKFKTPGPDEIYPRVLNTKYRSVSLNSVIGEINVYELYRYFVGKTAYMTFSKHPVQNNKMEEKYI